jgi:hypothetical protein
MLDLDVKSVHVAVPRRREAQVVVVALGLGAAVELRNRLAFLGEREEFFVRLLLMRERVVILHGGIVYLTVRPEDDLQVRNIERLQVDGLGLRGVLLHLLDLPVDAGGLGLPQLRHRVAVAAHQARGLEALLELHHVHARLRGHGLHLRDDLAHRLQERFVADHAGLRVHAHPEAVYHLLNGGVH